MPSPNYAAILKERLLDSRRTQQSASPRSAPTRQAPRVGEPPLSPSYSPPNPPVKGGAGPQRGSLGNIDRFKAAGLKPPKNASEIGFYNATHQHGKPMEGLLQKLREAKRQQSLGGTPTKPQGGATPRLGVGPAGTELGAAPRKPRRRDPSASVSYGPR